MRSWISCDHRVFVLKLGFDFDFDFDLSREL